MTTFNVDVQYEWNDKLVTWRVAVTDQMGEVRHESGVLTNTGTTTHEEVENAAIAAALEAAKKLAR